jgi:hypothetical protein
MSQKAGAKAGLFRLILLNNYQDLLIWCNTNNTSLLQFKKTNLNLEKFCKFIETKYKTKGMLDGIECSEKLLGLIKRTNKKQKEIVFLLKNLRMTMCELG